MGLFDRLLGSSANPLKVSAPSERPKPKKEKETFFLDPEASTSLGDVNFMRRSNTIRRTFPGTADSPGNKEMVVEVASMEGRLETMTPGLAGTSSTDAEVEVNLTGGVPKAVKKTFAQTMSPVQLAQKLKGTALSGVNEPGSPASTRPVDPAEPAITSQIGKPGATDPFKAMAKEITS